MAGAGVATINLFVDPWSLGFATGLDRLTQHRDHGSRTAKAAIPWRLGCETLLIGTSRTETGFSSAGLLADRNATNLALSATNVVELEFVLDHALESCAPSLVVLEGSFLMFGAARTTNHDFRQSPFNPELGAMEFWTSSVLSWRAFRQSLDVISKFAKGEASGVDSRGFTAKRVRTTSREAMHRVLTLFFTNPETYYQFELSPERIALFESMLDKIRARNVRAVVFIPPVHALQLEALRVAGLWEAFERWKVSMTSVGERTGAVIYDFADYSPLLTEAVSESRDSAMEWFFESSHFRPALGEKVLARIMVNQADPELPGTRLTTTSLARHLDAIRERRQLYALNNEAEIEWVEEVYNTAMKTMEARH